MAAVDITKFNHFQDIFSSAVDYIVEVLNTIRDTAADVP